ncbi:mucin-6-like [Cyprinodon tularosa]|uniref:mucin-6-like n=1 Tax=Cyprinodon tularosa TaxID=77115 RepID=UPI0018E215D2|nr:mucin-6-like [Cyprinodon tularosa]
MRYLTTPSSTVINPSNTSDDGGTPKPIITSPNKTFDQFFSSLPSKPITPSHSIGAELTNTSNGNYPDILAQDNTFGSNMTASTPVSSKDGISIGLVRGPEATTEGYAALTPSYESLTSEINIISRDKERNSPSRTTPNAATTLTSTISEKPLAKTSKSLVATAKPLLKTKPKPTTPNLRYFPPYNSTATNVAVSSKDGMSIGLLAYNKITNKIPTDANWNPPLPSLPHIDPTNKMVVAPFNVITEAHSEKVKNSNSDSTQNKTKCFFSTCATDVLRGISDSDSLDSTTNDITDDKPNAVSTATHSISPNVRGPEATTPGPAALTPTYESLTSEINIISRDREINSPSRTTPNAATTLTSTISEKPLAKTSKSLVATAKPLLKTKPKPTTPNLHYFPPYNSTATNVAVSTKDGMSIGLLANNKITNKITTDANWNPPLPSLPHIDPANKMVVAPFNVITEPYSERVRDSNSDSTQNKTKCFFSTCVTDVLRGISDSGSLDSTTNDITDEKPNAVSTATNSISPNVRGPEATTPGPAALTPSYESLTSEINIISGDKERNSPSRTTPNAATTLTSTISEKPLAKTSKSLVATAKPLLKTKPTATNVTTFNRGNVKLSSTAAGQKKTSKYKIKTLNLKSTAVPQTSTTDPQATPINSSAAILFPTGSKVPHILSGKKKPKHTRVNSTILGTTIKDFTNATKSPLVLTTAIPAVMSNHEKTTPFQSDFTSSHRKNTKTPSDSKSKLTTQTIHRDTSKLTPATQDVIATSGCNNDTGHSANVLRESLSPSSRTKNLINKSKRLFAQIFRTNRTKPIETQLPSNRPGSTNKTTISSGNFLRAPASNPSSTEHLTDNTSSLKITKTNSSDTLSTQANCSVVEDDKPSSSHLKAMAGFLLGNPGPSYGQPSYPLQPRLQGNFKSEQMNQIYPVLPSPTNYDFMPLSPTNREAMYNINLKNPALSNARPAFFAKHEQPLPPCPQPSSLGFPQPHLPHLNTFHHVYLRPRQSLNSESSMYRWPTSSHQKHSLPLYQNPLHPSIHPLSDMLVPSGIARGAYLQQSIGERRNHLHTFIKSLRTSSKPSHQDLSGSSHHISYGLPHTGSSSPFHYGFYGPHYAAFAGTSHHRFHALPTNGLSNPKIQSHNRISGPPKAAFPGASHHQFSGHHQSAFSWPLLALSGRPRLSFAIPQRFARPPPPAFVKVPQRLITKLADGGIKT